MIKRVFLFILSIYISMQPMLLMGYAKESPEKIKVGFINGYGITDTNGVYSGYAYDYLAEIAKYINIAYEFVPGDWATNLERIYSGEIDLLCPIPKADWLSPHLDYTQFEMGYEYVALFSALSNESLLFDDFDAFEGIKVGAFSENSAFERYKEENNFSAQYVFFKTVDEMHSAVQNGEIDAYILESSAQYNDVKMIARLDVLPYYITAKEGNVELIDKINHGVSIIRRQDIYFTAKLHEKHFGKDIVGAPAFTKGESDYLSKQEEIKIALDPSMLGVEYFDREINEFTGIVPDIIRLLAHKGGLSITFVPTENYEQSLELFEKGEVSAITSYVYDIKSYPHMVTDTLISIPLAFVGRKNYSLKNGSRVLVSSRFEDYVPYFKAHYPSIEFSTSESTRMLFNKIDGNEIDAGLVNSYSLNAILAQNLMPDAAFIGSANISADVRLTLAPNVSPMLASVLNKANKRIPIEEIDAIIMKDTVITDMKISPIIFLREYAYPIAATVFLIAALFLGYIVLTNRKVKNILYNMAYFDSLTSAPNLEKLKLDAGVIFSRNEQNEYSVMYFDIKNFKGFNEVLGHNKGNDILVKTCRLCQDKLVADEFFARVSADIFVLLVKRSRDGIKALAECLTDALQQLPEISSVAMRPVFEWGIYHITNEDKSLDPCLDKANYVRKLTKSHGEQNICFYDYNLQVREENLKKIEATMYKAMFQNEFNVFIQPKVNIKTGELIAAEALVRWIENGKILWYPTDFIEIFERNGFISELDMYMLSKVCQLQKKWTEKGLSTVPISLNQSKILISKSMYSNDVLDIVNKYGIPKNLIEIEITETILHDNIELLTQLMNKLQKEGFSFSIDDFGSGYSSLQLLSELSANTLKIDRGILLKAEDNPRGTAVLRNTIKLAREVNMTCICEGVETKKQEALLLELGCEYAQGYLYGRPMPASEFEKLLTARSIS